MKRWTLTFLLLMPLTTLAGTACSEKPQTAETMRKAFQLAIQTREKLDASGAQVALVGRVGQDLLAISSNIRIWHLHGAITLKGAG